MMVVEHACDDVQAQMNKLLPAFAFEEVLDTRRLYFPRQVYDGRRPVCYHWLKDLCMLANNVGADQQCRFGHSLWTFAHDVYIQPAKLPSDLAECGLMQGM